MAEALKLLPEQWRMWENYLYLCADLGDIDGAIRAAHRLLDLRDGCSVELSIIAQIVQAAVEEPGDATRGQQLRSAAAGLLGRLTSRVSTNPDLWALYAHFHHGCGNVDNARDCLVRALRASQRAGWERDSALFAHVARAATALADAYLSDGSPASLHSARLMLRGVIKPADVCVCRPGCCAPAYCWCSTDREARRDASQATFSAADSMRQLVEKLNQVVACEAPQNRPHD